MSQNNPAKPHLVNPGQNLPQGKNHKISFYQGIIPSPEMMEHYKEIDPSFPSRILAMAENEGESRRENERSIIKKAFTLDLVGIVAGLIAVAGVIWLCYYFVTKGYGTQAASVAVGVIVALATVFVLRKQVKSASETKQQNEKK